MLDPDGVEKGPETKYQSGPPSGGTLSGSPCSMARPAGDLCMRFGDRGVQAFTAQLAVVFVPSVSLVAIVGEDADVIAGV
jgi:hypothetical protein